MRKLSFEAAKAQFTNRYTMENVPRHASIPAANGKFYAPQYASDKEWYDRTFFKGESELATSRHCHSTYPTWPMGHWLDKAFNGKREERYFIRNCLGEIVGNPKGYKTHKGANMIFNRQSMQVELIDLAHAHKVPGSVDGSVFIGSIKLESI